MLPTYNNIMFWDAALHLGTRQIRGLQTLSRLMFHHGRGSKPFPLCEEDKLCSRLLDHVLTAHQHKIGFQGVSEWADDLLAHLVECDIQFVYKFWTLFNS